MKYNNTLGESFAVNAVEKAILQTELLQPYFRNNDKTPSWDGEIFVYKSKGAEKNNLVGVVKIQIKSEHIGKDKEFNGKYSLLISDLKNYLIVGGTILFLVTIFDSGEYLVYYRCLLPLDIINILDSCKPNQKKKTLMLQYFPHTDCLNILTIFTKYMEDFNKQVLLREQRKTLNEIDQAHYRQALKQVDDFFSNLGSSAIKKRYPTPDQFTREFVRRLTKPYIYKQIDSEMHAYMPLSILDHFEVVITDTKSVPIYVGEKQYYNEYVAEYSGIIKRVLFGKALWFVEELGQKAFPQDLEIKGTLFNRITDIKFLIDLFTVGSYRYLNITIEIYKNAQKNKELNEFLTYIRKQLSQLETMVLFLNSIHIKNDFNLDALSTDKIKSLIAVSSGLILGVPVKTHSDYFPLGYLAVGDINLVFWIEQTSDHKHYYLSSLKSETSFSQIDLMKFLAIICKIGLRNISNLSPRLIASVIHNSCLGNGASGIIGLTMSTLEQFYYSSQDKRKSIIELCLLLIEACEILTDNNKYTRFFRLNYLFIRKIGIGLNEAEKDELSDTVKNVKDIDILAIAYILQDDFSSFQQTLKSMTVTQKKSFAKQIIYKYWEDQCGNK